MTNAPQSNAKLQWTTGDRLGKALRLADVSNAEMATILGVSRNTVGNYIADRTPISDGYLRLWSMRTGVTFGELRYGTPAETPDGPDGPGELPEKITFRSIASASNVTPIRHPRSAA